MWLLSGSSVWARASGGVDAKLGSIEWDYLPASSRVLSIRRPDASQKKLDLEEVLSAVSADAAEDHRRFGCELRGCLERLPALKEGEIKVQSSKAVP